MLKKVVAFLAIIFIIITICIRVNATEKITTLDTIVQSSEKKYFENDQGNISKSIVESDPDKGEITIELKIANEKKKTSEETNKGTEVIFVIDNSVSMEEKVNENETRRDAVISAAKEFTSKLYKNMDNIKVGLLYYYGYDFSFETTGKISTTKVLANLTEDEEKVQNALTTLSNAQYNYGTNTDAGLSKAETLFSKDSGKQKYIILLSDGVPNHAIDVPIGSTSMETEERNQEIIRKTRETLFGINEENIKLITILTGLGELEENDQKILESVFGTTEKPTVGLLYNIEDTDIDKIIREEIFIKIFEEAQKPITNVKIVDYFPENIIDNFEFSYIGNPSNGTVNGNSIDSSKKTITWYIDKLKGEETATLKYKLKIKDMNNKELINKAIATNEKVVVDYTDKEKKDYTVTLESSPKIRLTEKSKVTETPKPPDKLTPQNTTPKDPTTSEGKYPYAGAKFILFGLLGMFIISIVIYKKYSSYKDVK